MEAQAWSAYWQGSGSKDAAVRSQGRNRSYEAFWSGLGRQMAGSGELAQHVDLACGSGLVSRAIREGLGAAHACQQHVFDVSADAVSMARSGLPDHNLGGAVGNACQLPYGDGRFALVTSQYGLEYAGIEALGEAVRILAPGGWFIALIHVSDGPIARECADNLTCLLHVGESGVLEAVETGLTTKAGEGILARIDEALAWQKSAPDCPARDFTLRLLADAKTLWQRRDAYHLNDALGWIAHQKTEVAAYKARMSSMLDAALTRAEIMRYFADLAETPIAHFAISEFILDGDQEASAWHLAIQKRAAGKA